MKLPTQTAERIADLINSVVVARTLAADPQCTASLWQQAEHDATVELWEEFGIALPSLSVARREQLARPWDQGDCRIGYASQRRND